MHRHALIPLLLLTAGATSSTTGIERLGWLKGCWERHTARGAFIQEQWMAPRGGMMMGMARTLVRDTLREMGIRQTSPVGEAARRAAA